MKEPEAVSAFGALAQETRLRIVRLLVRAGVAGVPAGRIAEAVGVSASNVSFHLKELERAGVVAAAASRAPSSMRPTSPSCRISSGSSWRIAAAAGRKSARPSSADHPPAAPLRRRAHDGSNLQRVVPLHGNTARSVLAEGILRKDGQGRFNAYSAGSQPKGTVNPFALKVLDAFGYPSDGFRSKSWDEFAAPGSPTMDFIFTVCDSAAGEACPVWLGRPMTAHWGVPDPAAVEGSDLEKEAAFNAAFRALRTRISLFTALPLASIDELALRNRLHDIGRLDGASPGAARLTASFGLSRRLAAEALGTALLVATVVGSGVMAASLSQDDALRLLCNAIATGAALVVLIATLGPISGAHFNPAVSLVAALGGTFPRRELVPYIGVQIVGGVVGVVAAHSMFGLPLVDFSMKSRTGWPQWFSEFVATFGLLGVILLGLRFQAIAIPWLVGLYITAAYWFTASTSFANPAVTLAGRSPTPSPASRRRMSRPSGRRRWSARSSPGASAVGCSRPTISGKNDVRNESVGLEHAFPERALDAAAPWAVEAVQQDFGLRAARRRDHVEHVDVARFVASFGIEAAAPLEARAADAENLPRDLLQAAASDLRLQGEPRHVVPQLLALVRRPALHDVPRGVERAVVVEDANPEGGERREVWQRPGVRAAHLQVSLQAHLGEDRGKVVRPIRDDGLLSRQRRMPAVQKVAER